MTLMMKHKQSYFLGGSFALVLFMMLGYLVKFYPADLVRIDADIQIALRADLPALDRIFQNHYQLWA